MGIFNLNESKKNNFLNEDMSDIKRQISRSVDMDRAKSKLGHRSKSDVEAYKKTMEDTEGSALRNLQSRNDKSFQNRTFYKHYNNINNKDVDRNNRKERERGWDRMTNKAKAVKEACEYILSALDDDQKKTVF